MDWAQLEKELQPLQQTLKAERRSYSQGFDKNRQLQVHKFTLLPSAPKCRRPTGGTHVCWKKRSRTASGTNRSSRSYRPIMKLKLRVKERAL